MQRKKRQCNKRKHKHGSGVLKEILKLTALKKRDNTALTSCSVIVAASSVETRILRTVRHVTRVTRPTLLADADVTWSIRSTVF